MNKVNNLQFDSYQLIVKFLNYVNSKNMSKIDEEFGISAQMYEELIEELERNFDKEPYLLSLIPYNEINSSREENQNRPIFNLLEIGEGEYIVECNIYNKSNLTDIILQGDLEYKYEMIKFRFPLFKS